MARDDKFLTNEGDSIIEVPVEKREKVIPSKKEDSILKQEPEIRKFTCPTCREVVSEDKATKLALDYVREQDGTLSKGDARYSLFCPKCQHFLAIVDVRSAKELQSLIAKNKKSS